MIPVRPDFLYKTPGRVALVLAGGAARGAYEVGVVQHIVEEVARDLGRDVPLDIICGTSVGAINGCGLAAFADAPRSRARRLVAQWQSLRMEDVVRVRPMHLAKFVRSLVAPSPLASEIKEDRYGGLIEPSGMEGPLKFPEIPGTKVMQTTNEALGLRPMSEVLQDFVAPLFEQGKVAANHLADFGISRYTGSVTSTKLKVTGIDLFSAGDFFGGKDTEEIVLNDAAGGVYKKLVVKNDTLVGAVLYGDTADGGWYFQLVKDGQNIRELRDQLLFGQNHVGDGGHAGVSKAASMPDEAEVCGCNGVCKGDIVKAIKGQGLFTLDDVRKHTKASSSCGSCTGLVAVSYTHLTLPTSDLV